MASSPGISERRDRDGRLRYRVRVRRAGTTLTATLPSFEQALAWRAQALAAADGLGEAPERPTSRRATAARAVSVEDAARRLCKGIAEGKVRARDGRPYKPSTVRKYEEALRTLVLPRIGAVPIASLTNGDAQRLVDELAAERTPEHARKALTALRVALRLAVRYGELELNPCAGVSAPADPAGEKPARVLEPEEVAAIVRQAEQDDARLSRSFGGPYLALAAGTGLRDGELRAVAWGPEGLDLDAGVVHVRRSVDRVRDPATGEYPFGSPKSRRGNREVPLAPEDAARIRRHRLATGRPADGALAFTNDKGGVVSPTPGLRALKRACTRAGIAEPLPRLHDLRHAYATHLLGAGYSVVEVAELIGDDPRLVLERYGHALASRLAAAGDALSSWRRSQGVEMDTDWPTAAAAGTKALQPKG